MKDIYTPRSWYKGRMFLGLSVLCGAGLAVTLVIMYFSMGQNIGPSYGRGITMLSEFRQEIMIRAATVFLVTFVFLAAGITVLAMFYSHRLAGPLYRLKMFSGEVAKGHLRRRVGIRDDDVVHPVADELNGLVDFYHGELLKIKEKVEEMEKIVARPDSEAANSRDLKNIARDICQITERFQL